LRHSGLGFAIVGSSDRWGVEKPDLGFFRQVVDTMALPAASLMYVGDRLDNDVRPAAAAGLIPVFLRRGPWAEILGSKSEVGPAYAVIDSLEELPGVVAGDPPSS
jgi:FMN phosphatase YigB (HAD superfamily)